MEYLYINGKFKSTDLDNISTMVQAFNYGTAAFEGMKAFYNPDRRRLSLFRPDEHYQRLLKSVAMLDLELKMSYEEFVNVIATLCHKNKVRADTYVRPIVYRAEKGVGLTRPSAAGISIFTQPSAHSAGNKYRCCVVSQRRPVDGSFSVKLTGNYLLSYLAHREAVKRGYDIGILLSSRGFLSEASVMNLFLVVNGVVHTPSLECGALAGITRKSIMQLAIEQLGLRVREGRYRPAKLTQADEAFLTGTGSGVNFIVQVEERKLRQIRESNVSHQLAGLYRDVAMGTDTSHANWLVTIS
jgi:branched-chain amino acid aminotransferase